MLDLVVPKHIGFIVDGNRRWAKSHGLPAYEGHLAGYSAVQEVALASFKSGIEFVSAYSFSTENWKRSKDEVNKLMGLALRLFKSDLPIFDKNNIKIKVLGSRENVSQRILAAIDNAESKTVNNTGGTFAICLTMVGNSRLLMRLKKLFNLALLLMILQLN